MAARPVRSDRHMSDFESLMWTLEADPQLRTGFANITLLDQPADVDVLRARLTRAAALIPQLRKRVVPGIGRISPPAWGDDPDFDIERHVRVVHLEPPGSIEQLCALAVDVAHRGYDPAHPLWEFLVIDGLPDGAGAMVQRLHHTTTDGVGAVRMSEQFIDFSRDAEQPEPVAIPEPDGVETTLWNKVSETVGHTLRRQLGAAGRAAQSAAGLATDPSRLGPLVRSTAELTRSVVHEATALDRRRSPLWTTRTEQRALSLFSVPLDEVRAVAKAHDCSINDVFVAGAAGGAGAYHRAMGAPVHELRMAMPVSIRDDSSAAGNAFSMARILVPTGPDPASRLGAIHERLAQVRTSSTVSVVQSLAGAANLLPTTVLVHTARRQTATVDFTTSNVRGAPFPLYIAGARMLANHPIGPLAGTAFNLTTLSFDGKLDCGLHVDRGAVERPDVLTSCLQAAFDELLAMKRPRRR